MLGWKDIEIARLVLISLLCVGVFLQMLGAPVSFWDLDGSADDFVSSLLMGLTVPSAPPPYLPLLCHLVASHQSGAPPYPLYEHPLFHPPLSAS
jgi:hypothetical protein